MQLLIVKQDDLFCPACRINISKLFAEAYPDVATYFHNKEHISFGFDTPESYNDRIKEYAFPYETYELYTDLST